MAKVTVLFVLTPAWEMYAGELENEFKGEQRAHQDYQLRLHEADEELAQLQKASDERYATSQNILHAMYVTALRE
jgi:Skp family chaperone for outer membrane proteins